MSRLCDRSAADVVRPRHRPLGPRLSLSDYPGMLDRNKAARGNTLTDPAGRATRRTSSVADGVRDNGFKRVRFWRILTTLLLLRAGYAYVPYSSMESMIEHSKEGYYLALRQTQETIRSGAPNWQPWVLFFLRALQQQMQRLAKKVERERIVLSAMPELSVQIVEYAREHGRVTIGDMATLTGTSRNTPKQHFRQLLEKGHLVMHGSGCGAWYSLA